jgi:uncharacterized protein with PQ loop repeat
MANIAFIAGTFSTFLFISSNIPMLWKAHQTKDLHSYSPLNIILANIGNAIYWVYVLSLPPGPIWLLHLFYTLTSIIMLALLIRHSCKQKYSRALKLLNARLFKGYGRSSPPSPPNYRQTGRQAVGSPCS